METPSSKCSPTSSAARWTPGEARPTSWPASRERRSGRQHRAEPDAIPDHLRVSLLGLLQLEHLDARADAGEDAEGDGLLRIDGAAARPARDPLPAEQRQGRYLEWVERRGDDEQLAARLQSFDGAGDRLAVRRRGQDQVCPSELLQAFRGRDLLRIDVLVRAQLPDELRLVRTARDGDGPEAHARGELDGEVAKAADALDRHGIARPGAAVAERVVRRDARAEQRCYIDGLELLGEVHTGFVRHDHVLGVPAVMTDPGDPLPFAVDEETLAAGVADEAVATVPADAHPVALLPLRHAGADLLDAPRDLVARNPRQLQTGKRAASHDYVAVADSARFNLDADLARVGFREFALDELERAVGLRDLHGPHHLWHGFSPSLRLRGIALRCTADAGGARAGCWAGLVSQSRKAN